MTAVQEPAALDADKLTSFVFNAVAEVGATLNAALVVMGDKLGLYRALAGAGPLTAAELARRSGTSERYVAEWLNAQAAGGFVEYDPSSGRYVLPPEQARPTCQASSRSPSGQCWTPRGSPRRRRPVPVSGGTTM
jgi:hypothetical protein